jgi:hypothetical protein
LLSFITTLFFPLTHFSVTLNPISPQQRISAAAVCSHSFLSGVRANTHYSLFGTDVPNLSKTNVFALFSELSRLSFDTTVNSSSSSPAQFISPSFSTIREGGGGEVASGCNLSLLPKGGEREVRRIIAGDANSTATHLGKNDNLTTMAKVTSCIVPACEQFDKLSETVLIACTAFVQ